MKFKIKARKIEHKVAKIVVEAPDEQAARKEAARILCDDDYEIVSGEDSIKVIPIEP